jgi:hypothetical protein
MLLTAREYYGIRRDATANHPTDRVAYLNFILGGSVYYHPWTDIAIGAGFQFRGGTPLHSSDRVLVGTSDWAAGPGLAFVYQAWRPVALWVDVYYLLHEEIQAFETDFRGQPHLLSSPRRTVVLGVGGTLGIL